MGNENAFRKIQEEMIRAMAQSNDPRDRKVAAFMQRYVDLSKAGKTIAQGVALLLPVVIEDPAMEATYFMAIEAAVDCLKQAKKTAVENGAPPGVVKGLNSDLLLIELMRKAVAERKG